MVWVINLVKTILLNKSVRRLSLVELYYISELAAAAGAFPTHPRVGGGPVLCPSQILKS
jgi:hypothetical protein